MVRLFVYLLILIFSINIVNSTVEPAVAFELIEENSQENIDQLNVKDVLHTELKMIDIHHHLTTVSKILNNYNVTFLMSILSFYEETPPPNQLANVIMSS